MLSQPPPAADRIFAVHDFGARSANVTIWTSNIPINTRHMDQKMR